MYYEIWVEGYAATGEHGRAQYLGTYEGVSWDAAVQRWNIRKNYDNTWGTLECHNGQWSVWGCRLFDNESDARRAFG